MASKYDSLKRLKKTKARVDHSCSQCGATIAKGEIYFREEIAGRFLHNLHAKKYCHKCSHKKL